MAEKVVRFCDFEKRSRQPDAASPRDPCEADIVAFPIVRFPRAAERLLDDGELIQLPQ